MGIHVLGVDHTQPVGIDVHHLGKHGFTAGDMLRDSQGGIVT